MLRLVSKLEDQRMSLLIRQLRNEGHSQERIGKMLGVSQSMVSALALGTRQVGLKVLRTVESKLKLEPEFFTDPELGENPRYRDFVKGRAVGDDARRAVRDAVARWLSGMPPGLVDPKDVETLEEQLPGGVALSDRTIQSWWQDILDERRRGRDVIPPPPTRDGVRKVSEIDAERTKRAASVRKSR